MRRILTLNWKAERGAAESAPRVDDFVEVVERPSLKAPTAKVLRAAGPALECVRDMLEEFRRDPLAYCLECWKFYMSMDDRDLGASAMKLQAEGANEPDVNEEQRRKDWEVGAATNAMIDDLRPARRWAMYKACAITTQWSFPSLDYASSLMDAQDELREKLRKNIATAHLF